MEKVLQSEYPTKKPLQLVLKRLFVLVQRENKLLWRKILFR